jgi:HK97 family phage major capsid protein
MRTIQEISKELEDSTKALDAALESGATPDAELTALDQKCDALKAEMDSARAAEEKKREIQAKNAERLSAARKPIDPLGPPLKERAITSGLKHRVTDDKKGGFAHYGDFLRAVQVASKPGAAVDENLLAMNAAYGNNEDSGSEGGFLIPPEYSNRIIERVEGQLPILAKCDRLTLTGNSVTVNGMADHDKSSTTYRNAGVVAYWVGEGDQVTRSSLKFRQLTLRLHKLAALSYCTDEELSDVANFGTRLLDKQSMAIQEELIEAVLFGTGAGQPMGAFTGTSPCVEVAKESDQSADTVVAENLVNMWGVVSDSSRGNGEWYFNGECWPQLATMGIAVGVGGSAVFMPAGGFAATPYNTIFGRPAYSTEHCEALGDSGDILFADFSQYLLAMKGTTETALSIHLRFDYFETAFRSMFRVDGRPAWDTNLKPRKGASTRRVSPFVKLAARA